MPSPKKRLEQLDIRFTPVRELIYNELEHADIALSLTDLETRLETVDKSSISRNLHLFMEAGIIHQIQDGSGIAKYAISYNSPDEPAETHAHFTCRSCGETICLEAHPLPPQPLPEGHVAEGYSLVIKGLCGDCARKRHAH
ncbi:MAG: transcriptional repressor [Porphyromonas sp.]|nr:transcriptional repressor [Porphyromonas sp.]